MDGPIPWKIYRRWVITMTTIRRLTPILILFGFTFLFTTGLRGQQKDFGTWWEFEIDKGLKNGIDLSGEFEQRFQSNSLQYDRTLLTVSGDYDLKDYLRVAAGFRTIFIIDRESRLYTRFRIHADATGKYPLSEFDFSLRFRFQYGFEDIFFIGPISQNNFIFRQKFKVSHHLFGTRMDFFTSLENWLRFIDESGRSFYKLRFTLGGQYKLNFRSRLGIRYLLEDEFNTVNPYQLHFLVFTYSYKL